MRRATAATVLGLAAVVVLALGRSTDASWSDTTAIPGTSASTGTLALQVGGRLPDAADLVPGGRVTATVTVTNTGTTRTHYRLGVSGPGALADALVVRAREAGCGDLLGDGALGPGASQQVCVELVLPDDVPSSVAGAATHLAVTADASYGGWSDHVATASADLTTASLNAPVLSCGAALLGQVGVRWDPVPGATAYRVHYGTSGQLVDTVSNDVLSRAFAGVMGVVRVEAVLGSGDWVSAPSDQLTYSALGGVLATCS